jgi:ParB family transcriptional regulator, chromosome partitioning protein
MSKSRGTWISRRGQAGAEQAIDLVIARQPQPGEQVQRIVDELLEDSPYQARQNFSTESTDDLAQGMRESGFQGVLIVRPHGDPLKRQHGLYQLVYGHRRRVAWRKVCTDRGEECLLPVVVREISDAQLLTIGAQENLQRQDLDPVEEAQIIAWHERMFFDKNQTEIGAMLGKSSDWVSVRSRIHKLPDTLKEHLRQRPRAIKQILELRAFYTQQPQLALELAHQVVHKNLTVEAVRALVNGYNGTSSSSSIREKKSNRRASATSVQGVTIDEPSVMAHRIEEPLVGQAQPEPAAHVQHVVTALDRVLAEQPGAAPFEVSHLHGVAEVLAVLAAQADDLSADLATIQYLELAEQALLRIRRAFVRRTLPSTVLSRSRPYRLHDAELSDLVLMLRQRQATLALLRPAQGQGRALYLVICHVPIDPRPVETQAQNTTLFVAIPGKGNAMAPTTGDLGDWARRQLRLSQLEAALAAAFVQDLQEIFRKASGAGSDK